MHFAATACVAGRPNVSFSGALGASGATSTVTGTTRTVTVPAGNSGVVGVNQEFSVVGGTLEHSLNGGGFVTTGATITFANGDTVQFRVTFLPSADGNIVTLRDQTVSRDIVTFTIGRT